MTKSYKIAITLLLLVGIAAALAPSISEMTGGGERSIEEDGGVVLEYEIEGCRGLERPDIVEGPISTRQARWLSENLERRVKHFGIKGAAVEVRPQERRLVVEVPGETARAAPEVVAELVGRRGEFAVRLVNNEGAYDFFKEALGGDIGEAGFGFRIERPATTLVHSDREEIRSALEGKLPAHHLLGYERFDPEPGAGVPTVGPESPWRAYFLHARTRVAGADIMNLRRGETDSGPLFRLELATAGADAFGEMTREHHGRTFVLMFDDEVVSAVRIATAILDGRILMRPAPWRSGRATDLHADTIEAWLHGGPLPCRVREVERRVMYESGA